MDTLLPDPTCFTLLHLRSSSREIVAVLQATQLTSPCPLCQRASSQVHSHYQPGLLQSRQNQSADKPETRMTKPAFVAEQPNQQGSITV